MTVEVIEESVSALAEYERVAIAFLVEAHFEIVPINRGLGGLGFIETAVVPYVKDYDTNESDRPSEWGKRFDLSHWGILSAFKGRQRAGGCAIAWKTPELSSSKRRDDLAWLWDLRVHPDLRRQGIGEVLFKRAVEWARERRCRRLMVETQDINVPACRFYARQGCELSGINRFAYQMELNEIQLLWHLDLE